MAAGFFDFIFTNHAIIRYNEVKSTLKGVTVK